MPVRTRARQFFKFSVGNAAHLKASPVLSLQHLSLSLSLSLCVCLGCILYTSFSHTVHAPQDSSAQSLPSPDLPDVMLTKADALEICNGIFTVSVCLCANMDRPKDSRWCIMK